MKKIIFLVFALAFFGCDDGDLALEEIDFNSEANVDACVLEPGLTLLFKIEGTESLILEIPNTLIQHTVTEENEPRVSEFSSANTNGYYRGFNTTITKDYFCDQLPDANVAVNIEYTADAGSVSVETSELFETDGVTISGYLHTITLFQVTFSGTDGQDVRYDEFDFGSITTPVE